MWVFCFAGGSWGWVLTFPPHTFLNPTDPSRHHSDATHSPATMASPLVAAKCTVRVAPTKKVRRAPPASFPPGRRKRGALAASAPRPPAPSFPRFYSSRKKLISDVCDDAPSPHTQSCTDPPSPSASRPATPQSSPPPPILKDVSVSIRPGSLTL
jgi:hypothetical protein